MPIIQAYCEKYMQTVLDIWLSSNLQAHSFIPADYWKKNLSLLRDALPKSEVYLCCEGETPVGFIGLEGDLIAGLFVAASARGAGVGSALLQHCQRLYPSLRLFVYKKNTAAQRFYRRHGFQVLKEGIEEQTGQPELEMIWRGSSSI